MKDITISGTNITRKEYDEVFKPEFWEWFDNLPGQMKQKFWHWHEDIAETNFYFSTYRHRYGKDKL